MSYITRVGTELRELDIKFKDLEAFINSETFKLIREDEQERMKKQHSVMLEYANILSDRIEAYNK